jgi:hypothetical protein
MKVLYINTDRGYGVYQIGLLFLDILKLINQIDHVDVYTNQCCHYAKSFNKKGYDFIVINEYSKSCIDTLINTYKNIPLINIAHSKGTFPKYLLNIALNQDTDLKNNIHSLDFVPGNIWMNKNKKRAGTLLSCRICEEKIPLDLLPEKLDVYGPVIDEAILPYINYKGFFTPQEMVDIYNQYESLLVISKTECLCMPIREALLCGCTPIVYDPDRVYTSKISDYIQYYKEKDKKIKPFSYTFEEMVFQFTFYLRAILGKCLTLEKNNAVTVNYLHENDNKDYLYTYDIFDKELLWKIIKTNG